MNYYCNLVVVKQGEGSESGLNEAGKLQAEEICNELVKIKQKKFQTEEVANELIEKGFNYKVKETCELLIERNYKFDKIYSSNSNCAKQTLEPFLGKKEHKNVVYTEGLSEKDHSTLDKDLLETLNTGKYNPKKNLDFFYLRHANINEDDSVIDRIDKFIAKRLLDHFIFPKEYYIRSHSVLIVTHPDYFNIINSMFIPCEFSKIETTKNILNISFHHNWQLILDSSYKRDWDYTVYLKLYDYIYSDYLGNLHDDDDYNRVDSDPYDLKSDNYEKCGSFYRNGKLVHFWE